LLSQGRPLDRYVEAQTACGITSTGRLAASDPQPGFPVAAARILESSLQARADARDLLFLDRQFVVCGIGCVGSRRNSQPRGWKT
jgi:hypothetical protein